MSQQNSKAVQLQFDKGYIQQTDLLSEQLKIQQSRQNYLQAAYNLFSSIITVKTDKDSKAYMPIFSYHFPILAAMSEENSNP